MIMFLRKKKLRRLINKAKQSRSMSETREDRQYWDGIITTLEFLLGEKTKNQLFWW
jgi:hypothetical protein